MRVFELQVLPNPQPHPLHPITLRVRPPQQRAALLPQTKGDTTNLEFLPHVSHPQHERKDNELAYRKYKLAQSMIGGQPNSSPSFPFNNSSSPDLATNPEGGQSTQERPPSSSGSLTSGSSTPPVLQETSRASFPPTSLSQVNLSNTFQKGDNHA